MPTIHVQWLNTRTDRQRRELAKRFTKAMVDVVDVSKDIVNVIFDEVDPRNHAKGGVFYSDILKKASVKRKTRKTPEGAGQAGGGEKGPGQAGQGAESARQAGGGPQSPGAQGPDTQGNLAPRVGRAETLIDGRRQGGLPSAEPGTRILRRTVHG